MIRLVIASFFIYHSMGDINNSANISESENPHHIIKRMLGGDPVSIDRFPWIVSIDVTNLDQSCAGSMISSNIVLTAAHCLFSKNGSIIPPSWFEVRAGSSHLSYGGSTHSVLMTRPHKAYINRLHKFDDIGLIYVGEEFEFDDNRKKAVLPGTSDIVKLFSMADVAGWGATSDGGPVVQDLRYASFSIARSDICAIHYGDTFKSEMNVPKYICAFEPGKTVCMGDSGGPLVQNGTQIGIASMSICDLYGSAVFVRVAAYRDWIDTNSKEMNTAIELRKHKHDETKK